MGTVRTLIWMPLLVPNPPMPKRWDNLTLRIAGIVSCCGEIGQDRKLPVGFADSDICERLARRIDGRRGALRYIGHREVR